MRACKKEEKWVNSRLDTESIKSVNSDSIPKGFPQPLLVYDYRHCFLLLEWAGSVPLTIDVFKKQLKTFLFD